MKKELFDIFALVGRANRSGDFDAAFAVLGDTPSNAIFNIYKAEYNNEDIGFSVTAFTAFFETARMLRDVIYLGETQNIESTATEASKCLQIAFGIAEHHKNSGIQTLYLADAKQIFTDIKNLLPENDPALKWV